VNDVESLSHIQWECKYHLVFIPKYRKKALYSALRQQLGELLRSCCAARELDQRRASDARPRAYAGIDSAQVLHAPGGWIPGKEGRSESFWARRYFVSIVEREEKQIREYVKKQDLEGQRIDQLAMFKISHFEWP
jgi:REP-associated tyrosine transposase